MTDFETYSTPPPSTAFSKAFFRRSSIEDIVNFKGYPTIAPEHSVQSWQWTESIPRSRTATTLGDEVIPHANDLAVAYDGMLDAFNRGCRSIRVTYIVDGVDHTYIFSFSKLNLIKLVSNYDRPRRNFTSLLHYLESPSTDHLGLKSLVKELKQCSFLEELSGFAVTHCPLHKLASLVGEEWVDQDILDALIELEYFRVSAKQALSAQRSHFAPPTNIILPTDFLLDASQAYHSAGLAGIDALPAGKLLRCRISNTTVSSISLCRIEENHYTALTFEVGSGVLKYGDSMHGTVPIGLGGLVSRVLSTPSVYVPPMIERGPINLQGGVNGGGGSCSIAALNFIQMFVDRSTSPWRGSQSQQFRLVALMDLIAYVCIARRRVEAGETFRTHWARPACPEVADALERMEDDGPGLEYSGSCYQDFNLYAPTALHPVFDFLERDSPLIPGDGESRLCPGFEATTQSGASTAAFGFGADQTTYGRQTPKRPITVHPTPLIGPKPLQQVDPFQVTIHVGQGPSACRCGGSTGRDLSAPQNDTFLEREIHSHGSVRILVVDCCPRACAVRHPLYICR